jgi:tellurite resistance protein TerC
VNVPAWLWAATVGALLLVILVDLWWVDRRPHPFTTAEAGRWVVFYMALAAVFAACIWKVYGSVYAGQFVAGYLTEYSLSIDNLFVFLVIMSSFAVPVAYQHRVLLVGIVIALALRAVMILIGAAVLQRFAGAFYVFGAFLLWTAWRVARSRSEEPDPDGNAFVRFAERRLPTTRQYHGSSVTAVVDGHRVFTPMLLVMLAIGTTDVVFALDSIPAVFGLTTEAYLVFAVNAFALMGLRQLYFLLHGLLDRLVYLTVGLAVVLAFIGVKLILEAVHATTDLGVPTISTAVSLLVIVTVLAATALLSVLAVRRHPDMARSTRGAQLESEAERDAGIGLARMRDDAPGDDALGEDAVPEQEGPRGAGPA